REELAKMLSWMGVEIDVEKNKCRGVERDLSTADAKVRMMLVPTNEELMIARDAVALVK
ncbi:MAG: acetate kinase, partial [Cellulosilyticaceae bacterium]